MPILEVSVVDTNSKTIALTGDESVLIRYHSNAEATMNLRYGNMNLDACVIINGDERAYETSHTFYDVESEVFIFSCADADSLSYRKELTAPMIDYIKPTCRIESAVIDGNGDVTVKCRGQFFNDTFGAVKNRLDIRCRYKRYGTSSFSAWHIMYSSEVGSSYAASVDLSGLDYEKNYVFEVEVTDKLETVTASNTVSSKPIFHWGKNDFTFEVPVTFNGGINGGDMVVYNGNSDGWTYRLWSSGLAELWKSFDTRVTPSDWSSWGTLYTAPLIMNEELPFEVLDKKEFATIRGGANGFLSGGMWFISEQCTGEYYVCI